MRLLKSSLYQSLSSRLIAYSLRTFQRLATSDVIAIPRFDWASFCWLRRSPGLSVRTLGRCFHSPSTVRTPDKFAQALKAPACLSEFFCRTEQFSISFRLCQFS